MRCYCLIIAFQILFLFQYFDGLEEFTEANIRSPLKGDAHEENRQTLYEYILRNVDNINQIAYFGQLKILTGNYYLTIEQNIFG